MTNRAADGLVQDLLSNASQFDEQGTAYELLQEYFAGYPSETLRPLLNNGNRMVRRSAIWIASELGREATSILKDVIPLVSDSDRFIRYHALEVVMVCSSGEDVGEFVHILNALQSDDPVIRRKAMRLVSSADASQLEAGVHLLKSSVPSYEIHQEGLSVLLEGESAGPARVLSMITSAVPLLRQYGALAAKRLLRSHPELIAVAASSEDPDLKQFCSGVSGSSSED